MNKISRYVRLACKDICRNVCYERQRTKSISVSKKSRYGIKHGGIKEEFRCENQKKAIKPTYIVSIKFHITPPALFCLSPIKVQRKLLKLRQIMGFLMHEIVEEYWEILYQSTIENRQILIFIVKLLSMPRSKQQTICLKLFYERSQKPTTNELMSGCRHFNFFHHTSLSETSPPAIKTTKISV